MPTGTVNSAALAAAGDEYSLINLDSNNILYNKSSVTFNTFCRSSSNCSTSSSSYSTFDEFVCYGFDYETPGPWGCCQSDEVWSKGDPDIVDPTLASAVDCEKNDQWMSNDACYHYQHPHHSERYLGCYAAAAADGWNSAQRDISVVGGGFGGWTPTSDVGNWPSVDEVDERQLAEFCGGAQQQQQPQVEGVVAAAFCNGRFEPRSVASVANSSDEDFDCCFRNDVDSPSMNYCTVAPSAEVVNSDWYCQRSAFPPPPSFGCRSHMAPSPLSSFSAVADMATCGGDDARRLRIDRIRRHEVDDVISGTMQSTTYKWMTVKRGNTRGQTGNDFATSTTFGDWNMARFSCTQSIANQLCDVTRVPMP
jgi:hypothetical protein